jgi:AcrR family transcriptional regulator
LLKLLESKPLADLTIRDIAAESGIGYATFFRHHSTKESLLKDITAAEIQRLMGVAMPVLQATGEIRAATLALCKYVHQHRALWSRLLTGDAVSALRGEFIRIAKEMARSLEPPGHWLPGDVAAAMAIASTIELLAWWLTEPNPLPIEAIAEIYDRIIVSPIITSDQGVWLAARQDTRRAKERPERRALRPARNGRLQRGK